MSTRKRPFSKASRAVLVGVALLASGLAVAAPILSGKSKELGADPVKTGYDVTAPPAATTFAGVDLASFTIPGLTRKDTTEDDGGLVITYASAHGEVRAVLRLAVSHDATEARAFLDRQLHGIARVLPAATDPSLGDLAFTDDGETIVVATFANVAYDLRAITNTNDPTVVPNALAMSKLLVTQLKPGTPIFPALKVTLPSEISVQDGAEIVLGGATGQTPKLRAENGYLARTNSGAPSVKPFAPGPVTITALLVDDLGRIGSAKATAIAK